MSKYLRFPGYAAARLVAGGVMAKRRLFATLRSRPRLLVYTDSRGFEVLRWYCRKNPLYSYVAWLAERYAVTYAVCPHQHTTLLDFLNDCGNVLNRYDAVVLHTGIVDYSPRTQSSARALRVKKSPLVVKQFGADALRDFENRHYSDIYDGQLTASLFTLDFFNNWIIRELQAMSSPLIWVGVNRVVAGWRGNYFRDRPANMNVILDYQQLAEERLPGRCLSLDWTDDLVMRYTVDNVHLSASGFNLVYQRITERLASLGLA